jgi:chitinase
MKANKALKGGRVAAACLAAGVAASGAAVLVATAGSATAASTYGVAPYVDLSADSSGQLDRAIGQAGLKSYTAAFVIGSGCTPIWGDSLGIDSSTANAKIAKAERDGTKTIISFGGANGSELAQSCTDTGALTDAYQSVIDKYHVDHLDFDIEGAAIADRNSVDRRFQALRTLQRRNSGLNISVTIPVLQSGPDGNGIAFLRAARNSGTRIDLVNIMAMDYGGPVSDMGSAAISAARGTLSAARDVWASFGYGQLGITPMIGQNDQAGEIFTLDDARSLVSFADSHGVGRLAIWSVGRDQPCPGGAGGGARPDCSGVSQSTLQFTKIFNDASTGGGSTGPLRPSRDTSCSVQARRNDDGACSSDGSDGRTTPPASSPTTAPPSDHTGDHATWRAGHAYTMGGVVSYHGHDYKCRQSHTAEHGWEPPRTPALWLALN